MQYANKNSKWKKCGAFRQFTLKEGDGKSESRGQSNFGIGSAVPGLSIQNKDV